jgi:hypothetical protein
MPSYTRTIPIPGKTADEIYTRVSLAIGKFQEKDTGKYGKFTFKIDPAAKTISLESTHVSAHLQCKDGEVLLTGKLSFIASAFRGKIDSGIDEWISKSFLA